jgi:hypothetical protein
VQDHLFTTRGIAVCSLIAAAVSLVLWFTVPWLKPWMPNVTVGAITVLVTIAVIERVVQREAQRRLQPRIESALREIGIGLRIMVGTVALDYAATHVDNPTPIPGDALEMIDLWLSEQSAEDAGRDRRTQRERLPLLIVNAREFVSDLERCRERDREVMEPDLVRALDELSKTVTNWLVVIDTAGLAERPDAELERDALRWIVKSTRAFAAVFLRYAPIWSEVDFRGEAARNISRIARDRRDAGIVERPETWGRPERRKRASG